MKYEIKEEGGGSDARSILEHADAPAGSDVLRDALTDWLQPPRGHAATTVLVGSLLALLHPEKLAAGSSTYAKPEWRPDGSPGHFRAHWRAQASAATHVKEDDFPEPVNAALRSYVWPTALDTQRADRHAWLIKVPTFVASAWRAAAAVGGDGDMMEEDGKDELGRMRIAIDPFAPPESRSAFSMELVGHSANGIPRAYHLHVTPDELPMHVFSDVREGTAAAEAAAIANAHAHVFQESTIVLEGVVAEKLDMRPSDVNDEGYRLVSRARMATAQVKTRVMQSATETRVAPLPKARNLARADQAKPERRERMDRPVLEDVVFQLYERRAQWSLKQLVAETRQVSEQNKTKHPGVFICVG